MVSNLLEFENTLEKIMIEGDIHDHVLTRVCMGVFGSFLI